MKVRNFDRQRLGLEAMTTAGAAGNIGKVLGNFFARPVTIGFTKSPFEIAHHALERFLGFVRTYAIVIDETNGGLPRTIEDRLACFRGNVLPRCIEREFVVFGERLE